MSRDGEEGDARLKFNGEEGDARLKFNNFTKK